MFTPNAQIKATGEPVETIGKPFRVSSTGPLWISAVRRTRRNYVVPINTETLEHATFEDEEAPDGG